MVVLKPNDHENQRNAYRQVSDLPWRDIDIQDTTSETGHGRIESRSIKTMAIAENLGGIAFPHAILAIRILRRRKETGKKETRRTDYAVTSLDAHEANPAALAVLCRGRWGIENSSHHIRDVTFAEDASTVHTGTAPRAMAAFRNLAIGTLKILGVTNIAKTTRANGAEPQRALPILGISHQPNPSGT
jgi:predicted transposase YbfD/YdcC